MTANAEKRIGTWSFPTDYPFLIPSATCGSSVVAHANADLKPMHTRFFFSAPVGSGTLRFRVLIKQAEQGKVRLREHAAAAAAAGNSVHSLFERALTFLCACWFRWRVV